MQLQLLPELIWLINWLTKRDIEASLADLDLSARNLLGSVQWLADIITRVSDQRASSSGSVEFRFQLLNLFVDLCSD